MSEQKSTVEYDRWGGLQAAIKQISDELEIIGQVEWIITDKDGLKKLYEHYEKWMNHYVTELNKLGNDPKQPG